MEKTTIFASVKNLIRLYLTGLIFSRNVCNSKGLAKIENEKRKP